MGCVSRSLWPAGGNHHVGRDKLEKSKACSSNTFFFFFFIFFFLTEFWLMGTILELEERKNLSWKGK